MDKIQYLQTWVMIISLIITSFISVYSFISNYKRIQQMEIQKKLYDLQKLAFQYPYLEDTFFISNWKKFRSQYKKYIQKIPDKDKYLQYEYYCEMLFNFVAESLDFYKTESNMLKHIAFKEWVRPHQDWWEQPLEEHSNHDIYDPKMTTMIDRWMK